jgi:hypothetical protein
MYSGIREYGLSDIVHHQAILYFETIAFHALLIRLDQIRAFLLGVVRLRKEHALVTFRFLV